MSQVLLLQCKFFDQNYQPGKITLQVSVLIIKYLFGMSFGKGNCVVFLAFDKWYGCAVKRPVV